MHKTAKQRLFLCVSILWCCCWDVIFSIRFFFHFFNGRKKTTSTITTIENIESNGITTLQTRFQRSNYIAFVTNMSSELYIEKKKFLRWFVLFFFIFIIHFIFLTQFICLFSYTVRWKIVHNFHVHGIGREDAQLGCHCTNAQEKHNTTKQNVKINQQ